MEGKISISDQKNNLEPENKINQRQLFEDKIKQVVIEEINGQRRTAHFKGFNLEKITELTDEDMELFNLVEQLADHPQISSEQVDVLFDLLRDYHHTAGNKTPITKNRELFIGYLNNYAGGRLNLKLMEQRRQQG